MTWAPDYITVEDLANYLRITDDNDDAELAVAIGAASRSIDAHCNRQFGKVDAPEARQYPTYAFGDGRAADIDDIMSNVGLVVLDGSGNAITGSQLGPRNAAQRGKPWTRLTLSAETASVTVTGTWGWTTVPDAVALACRLQASRFHARRNSPYGIAGSPSDGSELRLLARVDPDVAVMLRPFRRPRRVG